MWKDISFEWKTAFEQAWIAFCGGSTPIGAAAFDENGELILSDHNRAHEPGTLNTRISHAEANLLRELDTRKYDPKRLTLYTTMESCPMCMGMIIMGNIKDLHSAARDPYCGMIHLTETEPYYMGKHVRHEFEGGDIEYVQLTIQSYHELKYIELGAGSYVFDSFEKICPDAAAAARLLFEDRRLEKLAQAGTGFDEVYDLILSIRSERTNNENK